mmetsp:Transcript_16610/g.24784  ORF Transcript_16610/g.24784 Transcript_16610/m.24784 type:complete len:135 (-) Transcript_16610:30-434(-)
MSLKRSTTARSIKKGPKISLSRDLKQMMYGFGDVKIPNEESVLLLEELVIEFVQELTRYALAMTSSPALQPSTQGKNNPHRLTEAHLLLAIRRDRKKREKAKHILSYFDQLKAARALYDNLQKGVPGVNKSLID